MLRSVRGRHSRVNTLCAFYLIDWLTKRGLNQRTNVQACSHLNSQCIMPLSTVPLTCLLHFSIWVVSAALQFLLTPPQRNDILISSGCESLLAAAVYSQFERTSPKAAAECASQGLYFEPMVLESSSVWMLEEEQMIHALVKIAASLMERDQRLISLFFLQSDRVTSWRANARAILKRRFAEARRNGTHASVLVAMLVLSHSLRCSSIPD